MSQTSVRVMSQTPDGQASFINSRQKTGFYTRIKKTEMMHRNAEWYWNIKRFAKPYLGGVCNLIWLFAKSNTLDYFSSFLNFNERK